MTLIKISLKELGQQINISGCLIKFKVNTRCSEATGVFSSKNPDKQLVPVNEEALW